MKFPISKSSVNFFILSFLPLVEILKLGQLNKRFYDYYVPVTLGTVTLGGVLPVNGHRRRSFALQLETSDNLLLF